MTVSLKNILLVIPHIENPEHYSAIIINAIKLDSRQVTPGDMFIAYPGSNSDGRKYIASALEKGASVILYDPQGFTPEQFYKDRIFIAVKHLNQYISALAGKFYNNPSSLQKVYAVTGTNGKTTCAYLLAQLLHYMNEQVGLIGTIGYGEIGSILHDNKFNKLINTTPDPVLLQDLLSDFKTKGIDNIVMEASSHALDQYRLNGINTQTAIFTNLSHDHLDYHHTIEEYYLAKRKLFFYESIKNIVINIDDNVGLRLLKELLDTNQHINKKNIIVYTMDQNIEQNILALNLEQLAKLKILRYSHDKIYFNNETHFLKTNLIGKFNIYNILAVIAALLVNNYKLDKILGYSTKLRPAPGRMEVFRNKSKNIKLIVDYAHTPDALQKTLLALCEDTCRQNIWCVFGCGGDRDPTKRPEMAAIAAEYADKIIITDDNPRTELPENIISDIKKGIKPDDYRKLFAIIHNRQDAIMTAMTNADENDVILIAGKGHEDYQIYGTEYLNYNERQFVAELIKND